MEDFKSGERYLCKIKVRESEIYILKPNTKWLDGLELVLEAWWPIGKDEEPLYEGEWALGVPHELRGATADPLQKAGITWIASGDVTVLDVLE